MTPQAVILTGGKGTRLSAIYPNQPKALVPIAGKPFIQWQLEWLARQGIFSIHLATGHMSDAIEAWLSDHAEVGASAQVSGSARRLALPLFGRAKPPAEPSCVTLSATADSPRRKIPRLQASHISLSQEPRPLGTGGGIKFAEPFIVSDPFLVLNGDTLLPALKIKKMISAHKTNNTTMTLAITRTQSASQYGTIEFDPTGRITAFLEKADREDGWINGGVYVARRDLLSQIPSDTIQSLETDIFPKLASIGQLSAFKTPPPLLDMGTPEGMDEMEAFLSGAFDFNDK